MTNPDNPTPGTTDMVNYLMQAYALDINDRLRDSGRTELSQLFQARDIVLPELPGFEGANKTPVPDMDPFVIFEDDRVRVSATLVYHFPIWPAFAYRFDTDQGSVVFSGDTARSNNLLRLAKDCDVLVHEVIDVEWINALFPPPVSAVQEAFKNHLIESHTSIEEVGKVTEDGDSSALREWSPSND